MQDHVDMLYDLDQPRQERVRQRVKEIVHDTQTAENLQAWYPTWCKRPCVRLFSEAKRSFLAICLADVNFLRK
jgi:hypothetical protein